MSLKLTAEPWRPVRFEGWEYVDTDELRSAMRNSLAKKGKEAGMEIDKAVNQAKLEIHEHWEKQRKELDAQYREKVAPIEEQLEKCIQARDKLQQAMNNYHDTKENLTLSPASAIVESVQQQFVEEPTLSLPVTRKSLINWRQEDEEKTLMRIYGGTGFALKNAALYENSFVLRNALPALHEKQQARLIKQHQETTAYRMARSNWAAKSTHAAKAIDEAAVVEEPKEQWELLNINGAHYHAFYLRHSDTPLGKKTLVARAHQARTPDEQRLLYIAGLPVNTVVSEQDNAFLDSIMPTKVRSGQARIHRIAKNVTDAEGNTALHLAVIQHNMDLCRRLLQNGALATVYNKYGNTALHVAAMYGHADMVCEILKHQPHTLTQTTHNRESALCLAVLQHQLDVVRVLVEQHDADINEVGINGVPLLYTALYQGATEIVDFLLQQPGIDCQFQLENGNTLLHLAVQLGQVPTVELLLARCVNPTLLNRQGLSALHLAALSGNSSMLQCLLNKRPDLLDTKDASGCTLLDLALIQRQTAMAQMLILNGSDLANQANGKDTLALAIDAREPLLITMIVQKLVKLERFKINQLTPLQRSNLHQIAQLGYWDSFQVLLNADPEFLTTSLLDNDEQAVDEGQCYIDLLIAKNAFSVLQPLLKMNEMAVKIRSYVKQNLAHVYRLALRHRAEGVMIILSEKNFANPYAFDEQPFHPSNPKNIANTSQKPAQAATPAQPTPSQNKNAVARLTEAVQNAASFFQTGNVLARLNSFWSSPGPSKAEGSDSEQDPSEIVGDTWEDADSFEQESVADNDAKSEQADRYQSYTLLEFAVRHGLSSIYKPYFAREQVELTGNSSDGKNLLYLAAENGNVRLILDLLPRGISGFSKNGRHFFYALIEHGHAALIREIWTQAERSTLIDINAPIDTVRGYGALHLACARGDLEAARALNELGAKYQVPDSAAKLLPLEHAILNNAFHMVRIIPFFPHQLARLKEFVVFAIKNHKLQALAELLKVYPEFSAQLLNPIDLSGKGENLQTAEEISFQVWEAAMTDGDESTASFLITHLKLPLDPSLVGLAVLHNQPKICRLLLRAGLTANRIDADGNTALHLACRQKQVECVKVLLQEPTTQTQLRNKDGKLARELADGWIAEVIFSPQKTAQCQAELLQSLKAHTLGQFKQLVTRHAVPPDTTLPYRLAGKTLMLSLLDIAVLENNQPVIHYLLQESSHCAYQVNELGLTPMHFLLRSLTQSKFAVSVFDQYQIDLFYTPPASGYTLLHTAVRFGNVAIMNELIARGLDMYAESADGENIMHIAILDNRVELIKTLITAHHYQVDHRDTLGYTAVGWAVKAGSLELVQFFAEVGATLHAPQGYKRRTLVHLAAEQGNTELVSYFMLCGVRSTLSDQTGVLPVHLAAKKGHRAVLDLLIKENRQHLTALDQRGRNALDFALIHQQQQTADHLLTQSQSFKRGLTFDKAVRYKQTRAQGLSQLELAILADDAATVTRLLMVANREDRRLVKNAITLAGGSPNAALYQEVVSQLWDGSDYEPLRGALMAAIVNDRAQNIAPLLSALGTDTTHFVFEDGSTPLPLAAQHHAQECLPLIVQYYAQNNMHVDTASSFAALKASVERHDLAVAQKILSISPKAIVNYVDATGNTLLHYAVEHQQAGLLACFLQAGMKDRKNHAGQTALQLARQTQQTVCVRYLEQASQAAEALFACLLQNSINYDELTWLASLVGHQPCFDQKGRTPVQLALIKEDMFAVHTLLESGADPLLQKPDQPNALDIAMQSGKAELVYLNLQRYAKEPGLTQLFAHYLRQPRDKLSQVIHWMKRLDLVEPYNVQRFYRELDSGRLSQFAICLYTEYWHRKDALGNNLMHRLVNDQENFDAALLDLMLDNDKALGIQSMNALSATNDNGRTPFDLAILSGNTKLVARMLKRAGATDQDKKRFLNASEGISPLLLSLLHGRMDIYEELSSYQGNISLAEVFSATKQTVLQKHWGHQKLTSEVKQKLSDVDSLEEFIVSAQPVAITELRAASDALFDTWIRQSGPLEPVPKLVHALWHLTGQDLRAKLQRLMSDNLTDILSDHYSKLFRAIYPAPAYSLMNEAYNTADIALFSRLLELNFNPYTDLRKSLLGTDHVFSKPFETWHKQIHRRMLNYVFSGSKDMSLPDYGKTQVVVNIALKLLNTVVQESGSAPQNHYAWVYLFVVIEQGYMALEDKTPAQFRLDVEAHFSQSSLSHRRILNRVFESGYIDDLARRVTSDQPGRREKNPAKILQLFKKANA